MRAVVAPEPANSSRRNRRHPRHAAHHDSRQEALPSSAPVERRQEVIGSQPVETVRPLVDRRRTRSRWAACRAARSCRTTPSASVHARRSACCIECRAPRRRAYHHGGRERRQAIHAAARGRQQLPASRPAAGTSSTCSCAAGTNFVGVQRRPGCGAARRALRSPELRGGSLECGRGAEATTPEFRAPLLTMRRASSSRWLSTPPPCRFRCRRRC